jgi:hypothetical protein
MGTLSPNQVLFVLRSLGKAELYQFGQGHPGESFVESFINEIDCPMGKLTSSMAIEYQLDYENDILILRNPPSLDTIRLRVENVGVRIPNIYRENSTKAMKYIEEFGSLYLSFSSNSNLNHRQNWLGLENQIPLLVNTPLLNGNDLYLNIFLETHLRDLCTDFDLYQLFPDLLTKAGQFQNRKEIINYIVALYQPIGQFWISFGFGNLIVTHNNTKYENIGSIKQLANQLQPIGIYQLAFLFRPGYVKLIYGIDVTKKVVGIMKNIYQFLLAIIRNFESRGLLKLRFSEKLSEFNQELGI